MKRMLIRGVLGAMVLGCALSGTARTVSVVSASQTGVELAFGDADGQAYELVLAYGLEDGGNDPRAWTKQMGLGTIAAGTNSFSYSFPAEMKAPGMRYRLFLVDNVNCPARNVVKYLKSDGNSWIDLGYIGRLDSEVYEGRIRYNTVADGFVCGSYSARGMDVDGVGTRYTVFQYYGSAINTTYNAFTAQAKLSIKPTANTDYAFRIAMAKGAQSIELNGISATATKSTDVNNADSTLYLFARHAPDKVNKVDNQVKIELDYFKLSTASGFALDLIPVIAKNGEACLWDRVSNKLFTNIGTGTFTAGPVQVPAGYVVAETPTAELPGIAVTAATATVVTLGVLPADGARELYVASGPVDGGDDRRAWAYCEAVATLPAGTTSYAFEISANFLAERRFYRFFFLDRENCPADHELSFLRSDGASWVDLGFIGGIDERYEGRFRYTTTTYDGFVCGSYGAAGMDASSGSTRYTVMQYSSKSFLLSYNTLTSAATLSMSTSGVQPGVDYTFSAYMNAGTQYLTVNNRTASGTKSTAVNNKDTTLYLFARHAPDKANEVDNQMKMELDWFRVSKKGVPFLDLRPAVSRAGEVCLYDCVENRLLKNIGTAPFTAGTRTVDAGIVCGSTETRRAAPPVDVADQTAETVRLAFAPGATGELYVASGPFDAGDERRNWTAFTRLATITANDSFYVFTIPADFKSTGRAFRFFLLDRTNCPVARELAYLESDGNSWIDLEHVGASGDRYDGVFSFTQVKACFLVGSYGRAGMDASSGATRYSALQINSATAAAITYNAFGSDVAQISVPFATGVDYAFCSLLARGWQEIRINGIRAVQAKATPVNNQDTSLYLFARHAPDKANAVDNQAKMRLNWMTVATNGVTKLDLVPAKAANGTLGMYDRISNRLFTNIGPGAFAAGAEVRDAGVLLGSTATCVAPKSAGERTFRMAHCNIGHLAHGNQSPTPYFVRSEAWRPFMRQVNADAFGFCEYTEKLLNGATPAEAFGMGYVRFDMGTHPDTNFNALWTKPGLGTFLRATQHDYTTCSASRYWLDCVYRIAGREVHFVESHLDPGTTDELNAVRAAQIRELIDAYAETAYVIIGCDFNNSQGVGEWAPFTEAGWTLANAAPYRGTMYLEGAHRIYDNIVAKGMTLADFATANDDYDLTDHRAVFCTATLGALDEAWWTGAAGDGDLANAANWACTNAAGQAVEGGLPSASSIVHLSGEIAGFSLPADTEFPHAAFEVGACTLAGDCDLSGVPGVAFDSTIDLKGHALTVSSLFGAGTITDTVGGGELHLVVPEGETVWNRMVNLSGALRLVKEGAGRYIPFKYGQTYMGGTDIVAGEVRCGNTGRIIGSTNSVVTVRAGAVLDQYGSYDHPYNIIELDGGTFANTTGTLTNAKHQFARFRLTDDSAIVCAAPTGIISNNFATTSLDLGGHILTIDIAAGKDLWLYNCDATNGTVVVKGTNGWFRVNQKSLRAATVDFDIESYVSQQVVADVHDLVWRTAATNSVGTGTIRVHGTFTPLADAFVNVELEDGAALDLSARTTSLSLASTVTGDTLSFASGARIEVDVHGRRFASEEDRRLIAWNEPPNVRFVPSARTRAEGRALEIRQDGLYVRGGLAILLR